MQSLFHTAFALVVADESEHIQHIVAPASAIVKSVHVIS